MHCHGNKNSLCRLVLGSSPPLFTCFFLFIHANVLTYCGETVALPDDRLGGRIHTHEESRGQVGVRPLELGAQWLHGTIGNSLFDFCVEEGFFDSAGKMIAILYSLKSYPRNDESRLFNTVTRRHDVTSLSIGCSACWRSTRRTTTTHLLALV